MKKFIAAGISLSSNFINAQTCTFEPANENQGATLCPPVENLDIDVVMELSNTFPARFGSFTYEFFSCDSYYLYTTVSIEDSNSQPLESGMRGLFF